MYRKMQKQLPICLLPATVRLLVSCTVYFDNAWSTHACPSLCHKKIPPLHILSLGVDLDGNEACMKAPSGGSSLHTTSLTLLFVMNHHRVCWIPSVLRSWSIVRTTYILSPINAETIKWYSWNAAQSNFYLWYHQWFLRMWRRQCWWQRQRWISTQCQILLLFFYKLWNDVKIDFISEQINHDSFSFINNCLQCYLLFPIQPLKNYPEIPSDPLKYNPSNVETGTFINVSSTIYFNTI